MTKNNDKPGSSSAPAKGRKLDVSALESCLWEAARAIRGPVDAPKFRTWQRYRYVANELLGPQSEIPDEAATVKLLSQAEKDAAESEERKE
jgi:hypothetical protein